MNEEDDEERRALDLIFRGQAGRFCFTTADFVGVTGPYGDFFTGIDEVPDLSPYTYFTPIPLRVKRRLKENAVRSTNILFAEFDNPAVRKKQVSTVGEAARFIVSVRRGLEDIGLLPSLAVYSGNRGVHAYWKLDDHIPTADVPDLHRSLASSCEGGDLNCVGLAQLLRVPGGLNETSGGRAGVVWLTGEVYSPEPFYDLLKRRKPSSKKTKQQKMKKNVAAEDANRTQREVPPFAPVPYPAEPKLSDALWDYIAAQQQVPHSDGGRYDRHRYEFRIFFSLIGQGWSDAEILSFAFEFRLPRHTQEWERRRGRWTYDALDNARRWLREKGVETRPEGGPVRFQGFDYPVGSDFGFESPSRDGSPWVERGEVIWLIHGQKTEEWIGSVREVSGCSNETGYRILKQFVLAGYVESRHDPTDRRVRRLFLTPKAEKAMAPASGRFKALGNYLILPTIATIRAGGRVPVGSTGVRLWEVRQPNT